MSVPDFQTIMLPLLQIAADGQEHSLSEAIEILADQFGLSQEDRLEILPSGRQSRFDNRVYWSGTHLRKAGLLSSLRRGWFVITERGVEALRTNPGRIDMKFLDQYSEYLEFSGRSGGSQQQDYESLQASATQTPREILEASYYELRDSLAEELLDKVKQCSPRFFEQLVIDLLIAMGYGGSIKDAGKLIGRTGDGGIDGIIKEDKLGLDVVYVQAKRWESNVGRPIVQAFSGSLDGQRARKGVLITTSGFTQDAIDYVERIEKKIILVDGKTLAQLMIDHAVGVNEVATFTIKRLDIDYFGEE